MRRQTSDADGRANPALRLMMVALVGSAAGCGNGTTANPYQTSRPVDGAAVADSPGSNTTDDPNVTITIVTPTDGATLGSAATVDVRATIVLAAASGGMAIIDPQSVRATVVASAAGSTAVAALPLTPLLAVGPGDYRGKLSLSTLPSGEYKLRVEAATSMGTKASATVTIKVDDGPTITVVSPAVAGHYKGILNIEAVIDSDPYGATAVPIDASIGGVPVALQQVGTTNSYRGMLDSHQPIPPLVGDQLLIVAARNARGTRSESRTPFVVDEAGPTISNTFPPPGAVVGGVITIKATIADDAQVLPSSVIVLIGNATDPKFELPLAEESKGVYSILFDTAKLTACGLDAPASGLCLVYPTLSFRAADTLGNETTVAYEIAIDNQPPLLDLDPPQVRDTKLDTGLRCSWSFDPLSNNTLIGDMPADGCMVSQVFDLRARVEDTGNPAGGLKKSPIAGLDPDTVAVYILDDTNQPLVVDGNGDGICDSINPKLIPTTSPPTKNNEVLKVRLAPVKPKGAADFTPDPSLLLPGAPACLPGKDSDPPNDLCTVSQPTIVISYAGKESAIWSVEPIDLDFCEGGAFDTYANNIAEGWACIAVAGSDKIGNGGVSAPLRVWISYNQNGPHCPAPPPTASPPPDCTGHFDKVSGAVTATPCTSRRYLPGEICRLGECF